jgi:hypothetical protein
MRVHAPEAEKEPELGGREGAGDSHWRRRGMEVGHACSCASGDHPVPPPLEAEETWLAAWSDASGIRARANATAGPGTWSRSCSSERQGSRKTARVAVKPCRKALPPTGPISPPQKKPARASVASASVTTRAS